MVLQILVFMRNSGLSVLFSIVFVLIIGGCQKKDNYVFIEVIGHGGNGLDNLNTHYHDNSLESIQLALEIEGCDGVELDVQISKDGTLWLFHDEFIDGETDGSGCIPSCTDLYLSSLTYSTMNSEKLLRLEEIPSNYLVGKIVYIDTRIINGCTNGVIDVDQYLIKINAFQNVNPTTEIIICTGSLAWLDEFNNAGYRVMPQITSMAMYENLLLSFSIFHGVVVSNADIKKEDVSLIHADGKEVVIFEMRSALGIRRAFKKMPDAVMTDNIRKALIEKY